MRKKIKVLVIDDSALMRQLLTAILQEDPAIEVVGTAADPYIARKKIKDLNPDVLTLDVEMPGMDGITFLEKLMRLRPMPVVMVSSLTERGAESTLRALELGAVDFVTKPQMDLRISMTEIEDDIRKKVHAASNAQLRPPLLSRQEKQIIDAESIDGTSIWPDCVIAIGASAGGTQAIKDVLEKLPLQTPGIVVVQHMPPKFTHHFAERLNSQCRIEVREAKDGDKIRHGVALIAPGGRHMAIKRDNEGYAVKIYDDKPVNLHRPSVDVLFESVARHVGSKAIGVILTGMGGDGARGLFAMKQAGAHTVAQDEKSCVVFGMPNQAVRLGGVCKVVGLDNIASHLVHSAGVNARDKKNYG